jgi:Ca2+-binding RTX toxin-like protein
VRKSAVALGLMILLVLVAAGVALAVTRTCKADPCDGTERNDALYERIGNNRPDRIFGFRGEDVIDANTFTRDKDKVFGGDNDDRLLSNDGDGRDLIKGGRGRDVCYADRRDGTRSCEVLRESSEGTSDVEGDLDAAAFE